ncbi:MAG TPA: LapA family protein [Dissulfurispiraceae bacterium]|nr:LapA family protein [Dissulfurispiraceae bacterium]
MVSLVFAIIVLAAVVFFSVQNASPVAVSFFLWRFEASLAVVLFLSVLVGVIVGLLLAAASSMKRTSRKRRQEMLPASGSETTAPSSDGKS